VYDIIIVGLGVYGSAILAQATAAGFRVLAVDQFDPPHSRGSSHGGSRLFRMTSVESEEYIPLAKRALEIWKRDYPYSLITDKGFAIITQPTAIRQVHHGVDQLVNRACSIARKHDIAYESLNGSEMMKRFPGIRIKPGDQVFYEPKACVIMPEVAIETMLNRAKNSGATLLTGTEASDLKVGSGKASVTIGGQILTAKRVVVCTGPWQHRKLLGLKQNPIKARILPQAVMRIPSQPQTKEKQVPSFVYIADNQPLTYAVSPDSRLPELKFGIEQSNLSIPAPDPRLLPAGFMQETAKIIRRRAKHLVPVASLQDAQTSLCFYTTTPDSKHIIRKLDADGLITLVSACSGHGFKYAPAIAENVVRDLKIFL
jgi:sarcosine oxidase